VSDLYSKSYAPVLEHAMTSIASKYTFPTG
jgi:hypothetical protein